MDGERQAFMRQVGNRQGPKRITPPDPTDGEVRMRALEELIAASRDEYEYGDGRDDLYFAEGD